ncbi:hypothetical protein [Pseudonocardia alni]|uniref:hypothetical protein n=1 Tax=Pseudonocardia alni TaxID=33907 RepID=UPI00280AF2CB|nr:hypothetical protein [Pseudonocardia alni]
MTTRGATTQAKTQARKAAHELLQARMLPITELAELGVKEANARAESDAAVKRWRAAQEAYAVGYRAARAAGWSPAELEDIGCGTQPAGSALRTATRRADRDCSSSGAAAAHEDDAYDTDGPAALHPEPTDLDDDRAQPA